MNERIKELHNQCIVRETRGTNAFDSYVVDRFDSDKFAELIIRECADIATINQYQPSTAGTYVLKHFGVNE
jgi:hypothetical protein